MTTASEIITHGLVIGGERIDSAEGGAVLDSVNPATGRVWARVPEAGPKEVDLAVRRAAETFKHPSWAGISASARGSLLYRYAELIEERTDEIVQAEVRDAGLTIADARTDVGAAVAWFRYYAGLADKIEGTTVPTRPEWHSFTQREPVGVVGAILPWNAPTLMFSWKVAPALAAGNTIVVKPAEQTPISALLLAELALEAGLPPGTVNVVPGYGHSAGEALVSHPLVAKVAFTGEHRTAQRIAAVAADGLKRVSCECGGKAPHIVMADADLERAAKVAAAAAFRRAGQSCALGSRIFVHRDVHDRFVELLRSASEQLRVGDPFDPSSDIGPQAHEEQLTKTLSYIEGAKKDGADLILGGNRIDRPGLADGYFVEPTLFDNVRNDSQLAQEEVFGPVAAIITFATEEELIAAANDVIYGLTAGVWTRDVGTALRVSRALQAGSVWINVYPAVHWGMPYGGVKFSGYGRENGLAVMHEYTTIKSVVIDMSAT